MLANQQLKTFLPTLDAERALLFYRDTLGLTLISRDAFALLFDAGNAHVRITPVQQFTPQPFTVLGWDVKGIEDQIRELSGKGVVFEQFGLPGQDGLGIWTAPGGTRVAWFRDPDGNLLSLSE